MIRQIIQYIVIALVLALLIGLLSLNFIAAAAVIVGAVLAWPLYWLVRSIIANWKRVMLPVIILLSLAGCVFYGLYFFPMLLSAVPAPPLINGYYLTITNPDWKAGVFTIQETVVINPDWISFYHGTDLPQSVDLPERKVRSTSLGLLSRQVKIMPDQAGPSGEAVITLPDGRVLKGSICSLTCGKIVIVLHDVPAGSFLAAKDADDIKKAPYINTETVSWSVLDPDQGITFAFVPPPFNVVRPVIEPLLGVSSLNQWLLGILGLISTLLVSPLLKPLLFRAGQKMIDPHPDEQPPAKRKIDTKRRPPVLIPNTGEQTEADIFGLKKKH